MGVLMALMIGVLAEASLGRTARESSAVDTRLSFVKVSRGLTLVCLLGFVALQFYYLGILMALAAFLQLVAGAYLFQRLVAAGKVSDGVLNTLAMIAGPVCLTLLTLIAGQFR